MAYVLQKKTYHLLPCLRNVIVFKYYSFQPINNWIGLLSKYFVLFLLFYSEFDFRSSYEIKTKYLW